MAKAGKTAPGMYREGIWRRCTFEDLPEFEARIIVRRGFDCRGECEHVPPMPNEGGQNHGQHADEWHFACRRADVAVQLICFSWIRNGKRIDLDDPWDSVRDRHDRLPIYGAFLSIHDVRAPDSPDAPREPCHLLAQGVCSPEALGYLYSGEFFHEDDAARLLPAALAPFDEIDLVAAFDLVGPFWLRLSALMDPKP